jgi:nicotinate dehydrogenase subunit A
MQGREITTLEGLPALGLQAVPQAFIDAQAAQCGYCLNGMIMMAARLLRDQPDADDAAIMRTLSGNLCRCGTHVEIVQAVRLAAQRLREAA